MLPPFATQEDAAELALVVTNANLRRASSRIRAYLRSAGWPLDIPEPSDDLIELTCQIASRLGSIPDAVARGAQQQQQTAGALQQGVTYGWDAWKALSGLSQGEKDTLRMMFPSLPRTLTMGSPSGPNPDPS